jgi:Nucleotide modification associated domain 2
MKLYSYVVEHDNGFAPNPYYRICTLAHCKYGHGNKRNIVELAEIGDWVAGTGGHSGKSAGNGKLVYAMRVDEKLTLKKYYDDPRFKKKKRGVDSYRRRQGDNLSKFKNRTRRFVLISREYYYFGDKARKIPGRFRVHPVHPLEKKGPGFRNRFSGSFVSAFIGWLQQNYRTGMHGRPRGQKREEKEGRPLGVPSKLQQRVC